MEIASVNKNNKNCVFKIFLSDLLPGLREQNAHVALSLTCSLAFSTYAWDYLKNLEKRITPEEEHVLTPSMIKVKKIKREFEFNFKGYF